MSVTEEQIAAVSKAPRITPEHIDSKIISVSYINVGEALNAMGRDPMESENLLTQCILTLENGFTITGESACASPANFNREIGESIAYDQAKEKIWLLEGYLLKQQLHEVQDKVSCVARKFLIVAKDLQPHQERVMVEYYDLVEKTEALDRFVRTNNETFLKLPEAEQVRLRHQLQAMSAYASILSERITNF